MTTGNTRLDQRGRSQDPANCRAEHCSGDPNIDCRSSTCRGPVGPHEPILTDVGSERVIAFYEPDNGRCAVHAVVYDKTDAYTGMTTAARVRVSLSPREMVHIDSADNESVKSLNLQCGKNAEKLTIIDTDSLVASGITIQPPSQPIKASASGF